MTFASWLAVWITFSAFGIALVYHTALWIERWSSALSLAYLVMLAPTALIVSWVITDHIVGLEHASCEELDPSSDRLHGASPSEFRARCIATQDNSEWLVRRKL
jgi:hypothetical protein